ncbi:hypothetical protein FPQ18DRAFT_307113 [Pyronema domesticum]|uniref:Uncharacterized protein n=1 Tax=Pyronema omphalodes (strain CBS 100304) TaxID=1076935 RepID=U4L4I2_PYROM|nr:hypothetical protein FPQ18DRAFT_307113 [Pyronema domesticum]CCX10645.1 Protein of unknown function [Pyronema omphalodes CBS 100304]
MSLSKRLFQMTAQPLSKSAIAAVACAGVFVVLFFVGLGVFCYKYYRSSRKPNPVHIGPNARFSTVLDKEKGGFSDDSSTDSSIQKPEKTRQKPLEVVVDSEPMSMSPALPSPIPSPPPSANPSTLNGSMLNVQNQGGRQSAVSTTHSMEGPATSTRQLL